MSYAQVPVDFWICAVDPHRLQYVQRFKGCFNLILAISMNSDASRYRLPQASELKSTIRTNSKGKLCATNIFSIA